MLEIGGVSFGRIPSNGTPKVEKFWSILASWLKILNWISIESKTKQNLWVLPWEFPEMSPPNSKFLTTLDQQIKFLGKLTINKR